MTQDAAEAELFLPPPQVVKCGYGTFRSTQGRLLTQKFDVTDCVRVQVRESPLWRRICVVISKDADIGSNVERPRNTAQSVNGDERGRDQTNGTLLKLPIVA